MSDLPPKPETPETSSEKILTAEDFVKDYNRLSPEEFNKKYNGSKLTIQGFILETKLPDKIGVRFANVNFTFELDAQVSESINVNDKITLSGIYTNVDRQMKFSQSKVRYIK